MDLYARYNDPWTQTLGLLALLSGIVDAHAESLVDIAYTSQRPPALRVQSGPGSVVANIIERASPGAVTVAWYDRLRAAMATRSGVQGWRANLVCAR